MRVSRSAIKVTKLLLACGILYPLMYVAMNLIAPLHFPGYDWTSQSVSELSAIGAPSRAVWSNMAIAYTFLAVAFGLGILRTARNSRHLQWVGWLTVLQAVLGPFWPPMHLRGAAPTISDTLHIAFAMVTVLIFTLTLAIGSDAFGKRFRVYSMLTLGVMMLFGLMTSLDASRIASNQATPLLGLLERINIAAFLQWMVVLSIVLLGTQHEEPEPMRATRTVMQ